MKLLKETVVNKEKNTKNFIKNFLKDNKELINNNDYIELIELVRNNRDDYYMGFEQDLRKFLTDNNINLLDYIKKEVPDAFFTENTSIKNLMIPNTVREIGYLAFADCVNLESITFQNPSNLKEIGPGAFYNCVNLKTVNLPEFLEVLRAYVFENCTSLNSVNLPNNLKYIDKGCFSKTGIKKIVIPNSVVAIGERAFPVGCRIMYDGTEDDWSKVKIARTRKPIFLRSN